MKREKVLWIFLLAAIATCCVVVGLRMERWHFLGVTGRVVPAALVQPADGRLLRDGRERVLFGAALRALQRRVDSLAADSAGRRIYDSLVQMRPGLMDSLKIAERYFSLEEINH